jgi:hypothetical protein
MTNCQLPFSSFRFGNRPKKKQLLFCSKLKHKMFTNLKQPILSPTCASCNVGYSIIRIVVNNNVLQTRRDVAKGTRIGKLRTV